MLVPFMNYLCSHLTLYTVEQIHDFSQIICCALCLEAMSHSGVDFTF